MKTQNQIKVEIYNALMGSTAITNIVGDRVNWINKPDIADTFPLITFQLISVTGNYTLGNTFLSSEDYMIQITPYADHGDMLKMDTLVQAIKNVMHTLKWRMKPASGEFFDDTVKKILSPTRWEDFNV